MKYKYAGSLFDTEEKRNCAMAYDWITAFGSHSYEEALKWAEEISYRTENDDWSYLPADYCCTDDAYDWSQNILCGLDDAVKQIKGEINGND